MKIAVARVKRYLVDDVHRISLSDLLKAETERVYARLRGSQFTTRNDLRNQPTQDDLRARLRAYEGALNTLLNLVICGAAWGVPTQNPHWARCFKRSTDWGDLQSGQLVLWNNLRRYPALLLLYGIGLGAIGSKNYSLVYRLFYLGIRDNSYESEQPVAKLLHHHAVMEGQHQRWFFAGTHTGLSDHLFAVLRNPLREYLPGEIEYERAFDWFEYLLCLVHCDLQITRAELQHRKARNPDFILRAPVGRFAWREMGPDDIVAETEPREGQRVPAKVDAVLRAGFFESAGQPQIIDKYRDVKAGFDRFLASGRGQWIPLGR
jgi:hypothetical protein